MLEGRRTIINRIYLVSVAGCLGYDVLGLTGVSEVFLDSFQLLVV